METLGTKTVHSIDHMKLEEYKKEKNSIETQIKSYDSDGTTDGVIAREVLEIGRKAKEIFMSSKLDEKQQLLGFFFSNLTLDDEKLDLELREPFNLHRQYCTIKQYGGADETRTRDLPRDRRTL